LFGAACCTIYFCTKTGFEYKIFRLERQENLRAWRQAMTRIVLCSLFAVLFFSVTSWTMLNEGLVQNKSKNNVKVILLEKQAFVPCTNA